MHDNKFHNIGEAAHICAAKPDGPRYAIEMTDDERRSQNNGIWLCRSCHGLIDKDVSSYSIQLLRKWKCDAEYRQYCVTNKIPIRQPKECSFDSMVKLEIQSLYDSFLKLHKLLLNANVYYTSNFKKYKYRILDLDNEIDENEILYKQNLDIIKTNFQQYTSNVNEIMSKCSLSLPDALRNQIFQYCNLISFYTQNDCFGKINYWSKFFEMVDNTHNYRIELYEKISCGLKVTYNTL